MAQTYFLVADFKSSDFIAQKIECKEPVESGVDWVTWKGQKTKLGLEAG